MLQSPFAPLPGTERPPRGLFVDRWGTLFQRQEPEGNVTFDPTWFTPGAVDALFRAQQGGWHVYLIGNEGAVAHGLMEESCWKQLEQDLLAYLSGQGVRVVRNYACLDHPEGRGAHQKPSVFLLPDTGLLYHAAQVDGLVLRHSWVIGDSSLELTAAGRAGCRTLGVRTGLACGDGALQTEPDLMARDLTAGLLFLTEAAAAA